MQLQVDVLVVRRIEEPTSHRNSAVSSSQLVGACWWTRTPSSVTKQSADEYHAGCSSAARVLSTAT